MKLSRGLHSYRMKRASKIICVYVYLINTQDNYALHEIDWRKMLQMPKDLLGMPEVFAYDQLNDKLIFHPTPVKSMRAEVIYYPTARRC